MILINGRKQVVAPWIVVTGLDGSGKTTLVDNMEKYFTELRGQKVMRFRSPHDQYLVKTLLNVSGSGSPDKDSYTDRTIFMLDNRILGTRVDEWKRSGEFDILLSQRGFFDAFVHGRVKNYDYETTAKFNRIWDLPKCQIMIHLCADADVAYARIKDDPDADKFETPEYIRIQEFETRNGYQKLVGRDKELRHFFECVNIFVDTTDLTTEETFQEVLKELKKVMTIV